MPTVNAENLPLQRIFHWEKTTPDKVYLSQPMGAGVMRDYTWKQAVDEARRMAAYLQSFGWERGTRVAILSKNCAWWLMSDFAIWMAGYVSVPLYPTLTAETVRQILLHSEAKACFVGKLDDWDKMKAGVPDSMACISYPLSPPNSYPTWDDIIRKTAPLADPKLRAGDELATIIYTSGTTGQPKGVMHSFDTLIAASSAAAERFPPQAGDRALSYLPLSHIAERVIVELYSLYGSLHVYFAESLDTFVADIQRAKPTIFFSVPRLWIKFQQGVLGKMPQHKLDKLLRIPILSGIVRRKILTGLGLDKCRLPASGAAPIPPQLLVWYRSLGLEIIEAYGMTENAALSHSTLPGKFKPGYVGAAYPGVEARVDPESGELQMRSAWVMLGYYKEPELTKSAMTADGWLKTGDKAQIDPDGYTRITGRVKDLFKTSKGKYVAPAPIEDKLVMMPGVEACCVAGANFGQPFGLLMMSLEVLQKTAQSQEAREEMSKALQGELSNINATLDPHEQLDFVVVLKEQWTVDNGMITPTLKVKRDRIEKAYSDHFSEWARQRREVIWEQT